MGDDRARAGSKEDRQEQAQRTVVNVYSALPPAQAEQLDRIEYLLGDVFHQNDAMLDILEHLASAADGGANVAVVTARIKAVRESLTNALVPPVSS